jgi:hypothetical protein
MNNHAHHRERFSSSVREERLLGQRAAPREVPEESFATLLTEKAKETNDEAKIHAVARERLDYLKENNLVAPNLPNVQERVDRKLALESSWTERDILRAVIEDLQKEEGINRTADTTWWGKLEPETRAKVVAGVGAGALGIAVIGGILAWRKMKKMKKRLGEAAKKGASRLRSVAFWLIAPLTIVGGWLGFRALQKWKDIKELQIELKKKQEQLAALPANVNAKVRQELEKQRGLMEERLEVLRGKKEGAEKSLPVAEPVSPETTDSSRTPNVSEAVGELRKSVYGYYARALLKLHPDSSVAVRYLQDLLYQNSGTRMSEIFNNTDKIVDLKVPEALPEDRKSAREYLVNYCNQARDRVDKKSGEINEMSLKPYLDMVARGYVPIGRMQSNIEDAGGNIGELLDKFDPKDIVDEGLGDEFKILLEELRQEGKLPNGVNAFRLLNFTLEKGDVTFLAYSQKEKNNPSSAEDIVLLEICERIQKGKTHLFMLPLFHGQLPVDAETDEKSAKRLLLNMPLHLALRMYLYERMILNENPSGLVLMQMEILGHLRKENEWKFHRASQLAAVSAASGSLAEVYDNLDLPDEQKRVIKRVIGTSKDMLFALTKTALSASVDGALKGVKEAGMFSAASMANWPMRTVPVAIVAAEIARLKYRKNVTPMRLQLNLEGYASRYEGNLSSYCKNFEKPFRRVMPLVTSVEDVEKATKLFKDIRNAVIHIEDQKLRKVLQEALFECTHAPKGGSAWSRFAHLSQVHKEKLSVDLIDDIARIANNKGLRRVIELHQHSFLHRWVPPSRHMAHGMGKLRSGLYSIFTPWRFRSVLARQMFDPKAKALLRQIVVAHQGGNHFALRRALSQIPFDNYTFLELLDGNSEQVVALNKLKGMSADDLLANPIATVLDDAEVKLAMAVTPEDLARLDMGKMATGLRKLTVAQEKAILAAHNILPSVEPGMGYKGSNYSVDDLAKKIEILKKYFPKDKYKTLLQKGVCGSEIAEIASKLDDVTKVEGVVDVAKVIGHLDDGTPVHMAKLVELADGNDDALRAIAGLDDAKLLAVVDDAGDATKAVQKFAIIGKAAKVLNGVAIAGDVFAIAYAGYEAYETHELIKKTPEGKLRDEYAERYYYHGAEAAVGGVGLVAGVVGIAAAGTAAGAIATPVALATLPVSISIAALYQKHKFDEDLAREVSDWKREFDPQESLVDVRNLGFGEAVGQETRIFLKDGNWVFHGMSTFNPILDVAFHPIKERLLDMKTRGTRERQQMEINEMNQKRLRAIVEEMTAPIQVPEKVKDANGTVRGLNDAERKYYMGCKMTYEKAKAQYLWENGQEILFHGGKNLQGLGSLLQRSETYGQLQHHKYSLEHVHEIVLDGSDAQASTFKMPSEDTSSSDQAWEYQKRLDEASLGVMFSTARSAIEAGNEEGGLEILEKELIPFLRKRIMPHELSFKVKVDETNFEGAWIDGDRDKWTELNTRVELQHLIERQAWKLSNSIMNTARTADQAAENGADILGGLWQNIAMSEAVIAGHLQNPKKQWEELKGNTNRLSLVKETYKKQMELMEAQANIEALKVKIAEDKKKKIPSGRAGEGRRVSMRRNEYKLKRYEEILVDHPKWFERHTF